MYLREDDLVDDNAAAVHFEFGQLLDQPLCLVQAQELGYADANKCCELRVSELAANLIHHILHIAFHSDAGSKPHERFDAEPKPLADT